MEHSGCLTNKKMAPLWYADLMTEWIVKSSRKEKNYHKYDYSGWRLHNWLLH